jgi:hypothetical protein
VGEVASSNLVVPTINFQLVTGGGHPKWVHGFELGFVDFGFVNSLITSDHPTFFRRGFPIRGALRRELRWTHYRTLPDKPESSSQLSCCPSSAQNPEGVDR